MSKNVKEAILNAAIELINEKGSNTDEITVRDICKRAGIGSGLVNYHFQTKENLIAQCIQRIISDVIKKTETVYNSLPPMTPDEKLRAMVKYTCKFLVEHENISRISIVTDLTTNNPNDNTSQTLEAYFPLMRRVFSPTTGDEEVRQRTYFMLLSLQGAFLRGALSKKDAGLDFRDSEQRDCLVDKIIDLHIKP